MCIALFHSMETVPYATVCVWFIYIIVGELLSVWEERKVRLYGENSNVHRSHSQNDSGDLRGIAGGDDELGCLCGKAGTSRVCDGSTHSSGYVVNGMAAF